MKPKIVFVYDLTRPVFGAAPAFNKTKGEIEAAVKELMGNMDVDPSKMSEVFEIIDSNMYMGGGRRKNKIKTRKNCFPKPKRGGTRKHKKTCKCIICKRR